MIDLHISGRSLDELEVVFRDFSLVRKPLEEWAVTWLRGLGYCVTRFGPPESPGEFCERVGINATQFHRKTRDPHARGLFRAKWRGGHLRTVISEIESTPEFDTFCKSRRTP